MSKKTLNKEENQGFKKTEVEKKNWIEQDGQPAMDMYRKENELIIQSALAGVKVEDLDISVENDVFMIKGKRLNPAQKADKHFLQECFWGNFSREIILPVEVDSARTKAEIKEGILIVKIPIVEKGKKKISIKG